MANWATTGNATAAGDFIGTTNAQPLVMNTNGAERVRVQSGGNVGIGIANPAVKLHVDGNRVRLESGGKKLDLRADGAALDVQSDTHDVYLHSAGPSGRNNVIINPFPGEGNVGVGTNGPAVKMHVVGNRLRLESGGRKLDLRADGAALDVQSDTHDVYLHSAGPSGRNNVIINPFPGEGNVGVGTNGPAVKMHVVGNRLRLESGGRKLDLRADGAALDVQSDTHDLFLHSAGPQGRNRVIINPFAGEGNVGIGTQAPADKLHVVGNVRANDFIVTSDLCLKADVRPLQGALDKLRRLRGVAFNWKDGDGGQSEPPERRARAGLIAQEVETVAPELVHREAGSGLRGVNVTGMLATLVEALKELASENDVLSRRLQTLEARDSAPGRAPAGGRA
jgi:hypothetical protein